MEKYLILMGVVFMLVAIYNTYEQYKRLIKKSEAGLKLKLVTILLTFIFALLISPISLIELAFKGWQKLEKTEETKK